MDFIDNHSDLSTVNYLSKHLSSEVLEKSLDKTGLVKKELVDKNGNRTSRWVKVGEAQPSAVTTSDGKPKEEDKKKIEPATPFNLNTDRLRHLKPVGEFTELPSYVKKIPPNWREVHISPDFNHDILAVGKDEKNRPQYIYHPDYVAKHKKQKFSRVSKIASKTEELKAYISGLENKDVSDCLTLIMKMGIRPGSERDTKAKVKAIGATTLRGEHVVEDNGEVYLKFIGKDGVKQDHKVEDESLKSMLLERKQAAGDQGKIFNTSDSMLRIALKPFSGNIKVKDLRTNLATSTAERFLSNIPPAKSLKEFTSIRNKCGDTVCSKLGNQRSMSLGSYIDPSVFEKWSPEMYTQWKDKKDKKTKKQ